MKIRSSKLPFLAALVILALAPAASAQSVSASLANMPEADMLIYVNPQRVLNEAVPKFMAPEDYAKMRSSFSDLKKSIGVDPAGVEYVVIALRFQKPADDLSFVAPDVLTVVGGDFSSDSLLTIAQLSLQDKVRLEKHGSKSIAVMKVDEIAAQAEKNPMLKSLVEIGAVALSPNSLAIGNLPYLKSAVDAADGTGRINTATIESLLRDPNVLMAASGAPLASFARAFGLFGTETNPRGSRCDSSFGDFYASVTMTGTNFSLRGAMNVDNPDTAKIIAGLLAGLMKPGLSAVPDKNAQTALQSFKMMPKDNEIVFEADIPEQAVTDFFKPAPAPKPEATKPAPRRPVKKRRR